MNDPIDRLLTDWLREGPDRGPREGLERALATTGRIGQRPGWTLPERWLPGDLTKTRTPSRRPLLALVAVALLIAALVIAAVIGSLRSDLPAPLFGNGAIVYEQAGDLFIADGLGGTPRLLVGGPQIDSIPIFSPQGDRIAFVRSAGRIMTVRPDGTDLTELATDPSTSLGVEPIGWAPDGSAFLARVDRSPRGPNDWRLYVIPTDGSGPAREIEASPSAPGGQASWRPDGRQIAFLAEAEGRLAPFIADADGTSVRRLPIDLEIAPYDLEWSPDGTRLSFTTHVDGSRSRVTIADIDADGTVTGSIQLPLDPGIQLRSTPAWSPDGRHLAFTMSEGSRVRFGIVEPDGSGYRIVGPAVSSVGGSDFTWAPDGRSLVVMGHVMEMDPPTQTGGFVERAWSVEVATGQETELDTPVASWQRLAR
jgi:Tol biopolymer transport system component